MPAPMVPAPTTPTGIAGSSGATPQLCHAHRPGPTPVVKIVVQGAREAQGLSGCTTIFTTLVVARSRTHWCARALPERGAVMTRLAQNCGRASYPFVAEPEVVA